MNSFDTSTKYKENEQYYINNKDKINENYKGKLIFIVNKNIISETQIENFYDKCIELAEVIGRKQLETAFIKHIDKCAICENECIIVCALPIGIDLDIREKISCSPCPYQRRKMKLK